MFIARLESVIKLGLIAQTRWRTGDLVVPGLSLSLSRVHLLRESNKKSQIFLS